VSAYVLWPANQIISEASRIEHPVPTPAAPLLEIFWTAIAPESNINTNAISVIVSTYFGWCSRIAHPPGFLEA